MISAHRVSQSIRRWSHLGALPFVAALAVAACGGKVVVDGNGSGDGGAGGTSESSAAVSPTSGTPVEQTCIAALTHLKACNVGGFEGLPPSLACEGKVLCQFSCIIHASCEGLLGTDPVAAQKFVGCASACN